MMPLVTMSVIRPSISTLVSSRIGRAPLVCLLNSTYGMMKRKSSLVWRMKLIDR